MLDLSTPRARIIDAALRLAADRDWRHVTLDEIASGAGVTLADLRRDFSSRSEILAAFTRAVDDAVLARAARPGAEDTARDRLFDVLMTRFEIMAPYKAGLKRIAADLRGRPGAALSQLAPALSSQYWMLAAAGIGADGGRGALALSGTVALYARVFAVWLKDDDPGLARTMAALDSRLRRGERLLRRFNDICDAGERLACSLFRRPEREAAARAEEPVGEPPPPPPSPPPTEEAGGAGGGQEGPDTPPGSAPEPQSSA